jgi:Fungal protein kinase
MAPKIEHLLDSSCYSVTYPPSTEPSDTNNHSPTGSLISQQHSSPFSDLPPYYPGSQRTLSLDECSEVGSTQLSEPPQFLGSNYVLAAPLPPYYPMPLINNLGLVQADVDFANHSQQVTLPPHFPPQFTNAIFSTPIKQRLGTSRPANEQSKITVDKLAQLLHKELEDSRVNGSDFISLIFPDQFLPIPIDEKFFDKLESAKVWDKKRQKLFSEPSSFSEDDIAVWLNSLAEEVAKCFPDLKVKRLWYAGNKMVAPQGSAILRKPDIVLLNVNDATKVISSQNTSYEEKTQWAMFFALGETTAEHRRPQRMLDTVDGKSYIMFTAQHDRRFVPALCFNGSNDWSLTITDRQGQLFSGMMSLRGMPYVGKFLRILISLMFGEEKLLGLDPNMIRDTNHHVSSIFVDGISYSIRRNIYSLQSLLGRGTKVWIVTRNGEHYILKDAWVQASRVENENNHLKKIQGIPDLKGKVPTLVAGEDVLIDGLPDNTLWYRVGLGQDDDHRVHRRVLTSDIGNSITTFTSKAEFIKAMIDIVHSTSGNNVIRY